MLCTSRGEASCLLPSLLLMSLCEVMVSPCPLVLNSASLGVFLIYSCFLPIHFKVNRSCCLFPKISGSLMLFRVSWSENQQGLLRQRASVGCMGLGISQLEFKSQICYLVALQSQAIYFVSVSLSFLTYKVGIMTDPSRRLIVRIESDTARKGLSPVPATK